MAAAKDENGVVGMKISRKIARDLLRIFVQEHSSGNYIYSLEDVLKQYPEMGDDLAAEQELVQAACLRWLGEAEVEALYETSDAHVLGVGLSDATRHAIFLEHLGKKLKTIH